MKKRGNDVMISISSRKHLAFIDKNTGHAVQRERPPLVDVHRGSSPHRTWKIEAIHLMSPTTTMIVPALEYTSSYDVLMRHLFTKIISL